MGNVDDWIQLSGEEWTLYVETEVAVDSSSYPMNDISRSSSTIKAIVDTSSKRFDDFMTQPMGGWTPDDIALYVKSTVNINEGDTLEHDGYRFSVIQIRKRAWYAVEEFMRVAIRREHI